MNKQKFADAIRFLFATKVKNLDPVIIEAWFRVLKEYPEERVLEAVRKTAIEPNDFFNLGTIISKIEPLNVGSSWEKVVRVAAGGCRAWRTLTDIEIATVSAIGGMHLIQNSDEEGLPFIFRDFQRQFPVMQNRRPKYEADLQRLKDLNMVPETYLLIAKAERLLAADTAPEVQKMLEQAGGKISLVRQVIL